MLPTRLWGGTILGLWKTLQRSNLTGMLEHVIDFSTGLEGERQLRARRGLFARRRAAKYLPDFITSAASPLRRRRGRKTARPALARKVPTADVQHLKVSPRGIQELPGSNWPLKR